MRRAMRRARGVGRRHRGAVGLHHLKLEPIRLCVVLFVVSPNILVLCLYSFSCSQCVVQRDEHAGVGRRHRGQWDLRHRNWNPFDVHNIKIAMQQRYLASGGSWNFNATTCSLPSWATNLWAAPNAKGWDKAGFGFYTVALRRAEHRCHLVRRESGGAHKEYCSSSTTIQYCIADHLLLVGQPTSGLAPMPKGGTKRASGSTSRSTSCRASLSPGSARSGEAHKELL